MLLEEILYVHTHCVFLGRVFWPQEISRWSIDAAGAGGCGVLMVSCSGLLLLAHQGALVPGAHRPPVVGLVFCRSSPSSSSSFPSGASAPFFNLSFNFNTASTTSKLQAYYDEPS